VLSGEDDLRTPLEGAERVVRSIAGAQLVVVPGVGHGVFPGPSRCPGRAVADFFAGRPLRPCRPGSQPPFADPIAPRSLAQVPPATGHRGVAGRTLSAVYATIADLDESLNVAVYSSRGLAQVGGLRAGYAHDDYPRTTLHGFSYVPGVRVSGRLVGILHQHGRLRISGRAAARGHLVLHRNGSLSGHLRGRHVRVSGARGSSLLARDR
jgi:hypothetical protein